MKLSFIQEMPLAETLIFENVYEPELAMDLDEKRPIIEDGLSIWLLIDGEPAGEIYGISPEALDEEIEDIEEGDKESIYCYSSTILPKYQGQGLGKILKAFWLGLAAGKGFKTVTGHATSPAMVEINRMFGAEFGASHDHWYGTDRSAYFYRIRL